MAISLLHSLLSAFLKLAILASAIWVARAVYRLTFHPLAKFPGPKLAAVTNLYGASSDMFKVGDESYVKKLPKLHDQYGILLLHLFNIPFCSYHL